MQVAIRGSLSAGAFETDDEVFARPLIDNDQTRAAPLIHRYVHGGFGGTDTRFSFHLPDSERDERRFFRCITPVHDDDGGSDA